MDSIGWAIEALKHNATTCIIVAAAVVLYRYVLRPMLADVRVIVETLGNATTAAKDAARDARATAERLGSVNCVGHKGRAA